MSYQAKLDRMVGEQVAQYEAEQALKRLMEACRGKRVMPYGYPPRVYCPRHACKMPKIQAWSSRTGGSLENGVPRVLAMELVADYVLGAYNPGCCIGTSEGNCRDGAVRH